MHLAVVFISNVGDMRKDEAANVGKVKTRQAAATRKDEAAAINIPRVTTMLVAKRG
jgi:hypothetical protein